ncbi:conserved hypothetical protein [Candidatus Terasakiella magnetica]|nr:conserved hypothetical protein [Candidatus Terasakiella magnetica]
MDSWTFGLKRALGETLSPTGPGLADALSATRRVGKFNRLSHHLAGMDAAAAARKGVGPNELTAILTLRMSEILPERLEELYHTLLRD